MKSFETADTRENPENLKILAALKSGQAEAKGFTDTYFMDNESVLEDAEIMNLVAKIHPHIIGYLTKLNQDQDFVRRWFACIDDPAKRKEIYKNAINNNLRVSVEGL